MLGEPAGAGGSPGFFAGVGSAQVLEAVAVSLHARILDRIPPVELRPAINLGPK